MKRRQAVGQLERALGRLRRNQRRRRLAALAQRATAPSVDLSTIELLEVLEGGGAELKTVKEVAADLNVDPARASRLVASALNAGLVVRVASQTDARRTCVELTAAGTSLANEARPARQDMYARITRSWSAEDVVALATLLQRFVDDAEELDR